MINVFLYCSYSGSPVGYQKAFVDLQARTVRRPREDDIPPLVNQIMMHGGTAAAAGCDAGTEYFLVKHFEYRNDSLPPNTPGKKVFLNCAFTGGSPDEMQSLANGFLLCFRAVSRKLGGLLVLNDSEIGYTVTDLGGLQALIASCIAAGGGGSQAKVRMTGAQISFIVLEGDWDYFLSQNRISAQCPQNCMKIRQYRNMLDTSREDLPAPRPAAAPARPAARAQPKFSILSDLSEGLLFSAEPEPEPEDDDTALLPDETKTIEAARPSRPAPAEQPPPLLRPNLTAQPAPPPRPAPPRAVPPSRPARTAQAPRQAPPARPAPTPRPAPTVRPAPPARPVDPAPDISEWWNAERRELKRRITEAEATQKMLAERNSKLARSLRWNRVWLTAAIAAAVISEILRFLG